MKICVFSDLHSNLNALNALFQTDDYKTCDLAIFLGDIMSMGPNLNECCDAIFKEKKIIFLCGNHDYLVSKGLTETDHFYLSTERYSHLQYQMFLAKNNFKKKILKTAKGLYIILGNKTLYFSHYAWSKEYLWPALKPEIVTAESIAEVYKDIEADYIFYGHEHYPSNYLYKNKRIIDVGSIGMVNYAPYIMIEISNNYKPKFVKIPLKRLDCSLPKKYKHKKNCQNIEIKYEEKQLPTELYDYKITQQAILDTGFPRSKYYANFLNQSAEEFKKINQDKVNFYTSNK